MKGNKQILRTKKTAKLNKYQKKMREKHGQRRHEYGHI